MSDDIPAAFLTLAFLAALAAWVPLLEMIKSLLATVKRRHRIARLDAGTFMAELSR